MDLKVLLFTNKNALTCPPAALAFHGVTGNLVAVGDNALSSMVLEYYKTGFSFVWTDHLQTNLNKTYLGNDPKAFHELAPLFFKLGEFEVTYATVPDTAKAFIYNNSNIVLKAVSNG